MNFLRELKREFLIGVAIGLRRALDELVTGRKTK